MKHFKKKERINMKRTNKVISVLLVAIIAISSLFGAVNVEAVSKIKKNKGDFYLKLNKSFYDSSSYPGSKHTYKIYAFNNLLTFSIKQKEWIKSI